MVVVTTEHRPDTGSQGGRRFSLAIFLGDVPWLGIDAQDGAVIPRTQLDQGSSGE